MFSPSTCPEGKKFGTLVKDCCECNVVKCLPCEPPAKKKDVCPSGKGARPLKCYTYTKNHHYAKDETKCYRPTCVENSSDAPKDQVTFGKA